jgi:hypothetical protein
MVSLKQLVAYTEKKILEVRKKCLHLNMNFIQTVLHSGHFEDCFSFIFSYFFVPLFGGVAGGGSVWEDSLIFGALCF